MVLAIEGSPVIRIELAAPPDPLALNAAPPLPPPPLPPAPAQQPIFLTWDPCSPTSKMIFKGAIFYSLIVSIVSVPLIILGTKYRHLDRTDSCTTHLGEWAQAFGVLLLGFGALGLAYPLTPPIRLFRTTLRKLMQQLCFLLFFIFTFYGYFCTYSKTVGYLFTIVG